MSTLYEVEAVVVGIGTPEGMSRPCVDLELPGGRELRLVLGDMTPETVTRARALGRRLTKTVRLTLAVPEEDEATLVPVRPCAHCGRDAWARRPHYFECAGCKRRLPLCGNPAGTDHCPRCGP